jgi:hypothetical protein
MEFARSDDLNLLQLEQARSILFRKPASRTFSSFPREQFIQAFRLAAFDLNLFARRYALMLV